MRARVSSWRPRSSTTTSSRRSTTHRPPTRRATRSGSGRVSPYAAHCGPSQRGGVVHACGLADQFPRPLGLPRTSTCRAARRGSSFVMTSGRARGQRRRLGGRRSRPRACGSNREPFCTPETAEGQCGEWASQSSIDNVEYQIVENPPAGRLRLEIINWDAPSGWRAGGDRRHHHPRSDGAEPCRFNVSASPGAPPRRARDDRDQRFSNPSWIPFRCARGSPERPARRHLRARGHDA